MDRKLSYLFLAFVVLLISIETTLVLAADGDGKGNNNDNGNGNKNVNPNVKDAEKKGGVDKKAKDDEKKMKDDPKKAKEAEKKEEDEKKAKEAEKKAKADEKKEKEAEKKAKADEKKAKEAVKKAKEADKASTQYKVLERKNGREQVRCQGKGKCFKKELQCPNECPDRKPKKNKKSKGCFINCNTCETTCKFRKPKCEGYGSICYDPRFVGGDGVMFYFHGATGGDFALVSDDEFQINAHFIGTRPTGRTRDFTWVQALSVMFDSHTLILAAKRISHWNDSVDALIVRWNGITVEIPTEGEAEWRTNAGAREVVVERTDDTNSVRVVVSGLVEMYVKVIPIGAEESRVHNYQLPSDDTFAHLETQFKFNKLTDLVEGVLGKTYQPNYVSPVKVGVPMPMMGGEDKYRTSSLLSPICSVCRFEAPHAPAFIRGVAEY